MVACNNVGFTDPDDDDTTGDDDDSAGDDDDATGDDDDATGDDDDATGDDDDATGDDDDATGDDDDDATGDDDDATGDPCIEDSYENNDDAASATPIADGTISSLSSCPGDSDYYLISLAAGDELDVSVLFSHAEGDIDVELIDSAGTVLDSGVSTDDNESLGPYSAVANTDVLVLVELYADTGSFPGNSYELEVTISGAAGDDDDATGDDDDATGDDDDATGDDDDAAGDDDDATGDDDDAAGDDDDAAGDDDDATGPTCVDDGFEENDSVTTASALSAGLTSGLTICDGDFDYYSITLAEGEILSVDALFADADGDIDIALLDVSGSQVASSTSTTDDETLGPYSAPVAGTYTIEVELYADAGVNPGNTYELDIAVLPAPCLDDSYEDNDSASAGSVVGSGLTSGLVICPADDDYYLIDLAVGETLTMTTLFTDAEGDIDIELTDPNGTFVDSSASTSNDETVGPYIASIPGTYVLSVTLFTDSGSTPGNSYDLDVDVLPAPCLDDAYEDNDTTLTAAPLGAGLYPGLGACDADPDYYAITLGAGDELSVDALFSDAEGDIDIELFDTTGNSVAFSMSGSDNESIGPITASVGGTYLLLVDLYSDDGVIPGNDYDLDISIVDNCTVDNYEPNDSLSAAYAIPSGTFSSLTLCPSDDDFFAIWLGAGEAINVDLLFSDAEGDIDLTLYDPAGSVLASSESSSDDESVGPITALVSGTYSIEASLWSDAGSYPGNDYDLVVGLPGCQEDDLEPNDSSLTATSTGSALSYSASARTLCDTVDTDWFEVFMFAGETLDVDLTFIDSDGDVELEIYGPPGPFWLDGSYSANDDESISYAVNTTGDYYARVYMNSDDFFSGQVYDIDININ